MRITPRTAEEINAIKTPEDMWERILNAADGHWEEGDPMRIDLVSPLIHATLNTCYHQKFTREQAAMVMAFHALERLEYIYEEYYKIKMRTVKPTIITPAHAGGIVDIDKIKEVDNEKL